MLDDLWAYWLSEELKKQEISQRKFCDDLKISKDSLRGWIHSGKDVKLSSVIKILDYLGYDICFKKRR